MLGYPYAHLQEENCYVSPVTAPPPLTTWPRPTAGSLEPSRREKPLELLLEHSSAAPGVWRPIVADEDWRCYSFLWPRALSPEMSGHFLKRLTETAPWVELKNTKGTSVTRCTCWYARGGCKCYYTYGRGTRVENSRAVEQKDMTERADDSPEKHEPESEESDALSGNGDESLAQEDDGISREFEEVMQELTAHVFGKLFPGLGEEAWPNSANVNLYRDGRQAVGWHADDESLFKGKDSDCPIVSISLGATREFWIALKRGGKSKSMDPCLPTIAEVDLQDGDIMTMEGRLQQHCVHLVPKVNPREPLYSERINITFRWVRDHRFRCPLRQRRGRSIQLPRALRGLFGEVQPRKGGKAGGKKEEIDLARPAILFGAAYARSWNYELAEMGMQVDAHNVQWMKCDDCRHVCFEDGRTCCQGFGEYEGMWFCRKCWLKWTPVGEDPNEHGRPALGPLASSASSVAVGCGSPAAAMEQTLYGMQMSYGQDAAFEVPWMSADVSHTLAGDPYSVGDVAADAYAAAWWTAYATSSALAAAALSPQISSTAAGGVEASFTSTAPMILSASQTPTCSLSLESALGSSAVAASTAPMMSAPSTSLAMRSSFQGLGSQPTIATQDSAAAELKALLGVGGFAPVKSDASSQASTAPTATVTIDMPTVLNPRPPPPPPPPQPAQPSSSSSTGRQIWSQGDVIATATIPSPNCGLQGAANAEEDLDHQPLACGWSVWVVMHNDSAQWSDALRCVHGPTRSSRELWRYVRRMKSPSSIRDTDHCVFHDNIKPAREDPRVQYGGRWIAAISVGTTGRRGMLAPDVFSEALDTAWFALLRTVVIGGCNEGNLVCGAALSVRAAGDSQDLASAKLAVWLSKADDKSAVRAIGSSFQEALKTSAAPVPCKGWQLAFEDFQRGVTLRI